MAQTPQWSIFRAAVFETETMHVLWYQGESRIVIGEDEKTPGNSLMANVIVDRLNSGAEIAEYHESGDWIIDRPVSTGSDDNGVLILDIDGDVRIEILDSDDVEENVRLAQKVAMILNTTDFSNLASIPLVRIPPTVPTPFVQTLPVRNHG
ncbi:hypothetical protein IC232_03325 [Microvirga sp. BT688]|uniref:hypothetical protein n=1 Tax=Microvirga sp. TaxID=1873136 RepID=UPI001683D2DB|nr:hypothetical protein [Microvirga sp.]MBD2745720.1 hypothetical protein [Microvirga sp.]